LSHQESRLTVEARSACVAGVKKSEIQTCTDQINAAGNGQSAQIPNDLMIWKVRQENDL